MLARRVSFALLAVPVAVLNEAAGWRDLEPDPFAAVVYVSMFVGVLVVGAFGGWLGGGVFLAAYLAAVAVEQTWVYEEPVPSTCDPFCSSPDALLFLVLPFYVVVMGLAAGVRRLIVVAIARRPRRA